MLQKRALETHNQGREANGNKGHGVVGDIQEKHEGRVGESCCKENREDSRMGRIWGRGSDLSTWEALIFPGSLLESRKECDSPKPFSDPQGWAGGGGQNQASSLLPCPLPVPPHSPAHADVTNGWQHTPSWSLTILLSPGLPATANQSEWHQGTNHLSPGQDVPIMGPCLWFPAHVAGQCFY